MKKFRRHRFHSKILVPLAISEEATNGDAIEVIDRWQRDVRKDYFFTVGEQVCSVDALDVVMRVDRIVKEYDKDKKPRILGIECHWWEDTDET